MTQTPSPQTSNEGHINPFEVAAGMLRQDATLLLPLFLVVSLTTAADALFHTRTITSLGTLLFADRILQSLVVAFISIRWAQRFERHKRSPSQRVAAVYRIVLLALGIWGIVNLPFFLSVYASNDLFRVALLASGFVGILWALRYYFFFATATLIGGTLRYSARFALLVAIKEPRAALRSMAAPLGLAALATAALLTPYPDGRSLIVNGIAASAEGIFWILSTYTGFAYALVALDDSEWRRVGLEPYRIEQLRTLQAQGRTRVARLLTPSAGVKMLVLALIVFIGNLSREMSMAPATAIQVKNVAVDDYKITIEVTISDASYDFRGFKPYAFRIASKSGEKISEELVRASLSPDKAEVIPAVSPDKEPRSLFLEFRSNKSKEKLVAIDYAWLWYQLVPLEALRMDQTAP